jgi:hypothetical protein
MENISKGPVFRDFVTILTNGVYAGQQGGCKTTEAVDMNGRFQPQGGKNWILPKVMNANRSFWYFPWLDIWSNHFCPSMGPNGGSVAMDSEYMYRSTGSPLPP